MHSTRRAMLWLAVALCLVFSPMSAFAVNESVHAGSIEVGAVSADSNSGASEESTSSDANDPSASAQAADRDSAVDEDEKQLQAEKKKRDEVQADLKEELEQIESEKQKEDKQAKKQGKKTKQVKTQRTDKVLGYERSAIEKIGTQEQTGHTICCPSFSCAYGDAVMDGTVHDHTYYTCSCCTWNDWGGGASVSRSAGSSEKLLREAYDQISSGKPTVIHVAGYGSGEHWICLIGYQNADNPDSLTLDNFVALDPWDGAEITASERYSLYGDGCEHISTR